MASRGPRGSLCTNCGETGHHYKHCSAPITSYGIIAFRVHNDDWNQASMLAADDTVFTGIPQDAVEFLLIQRRDSIGFVELLRAKYKLTDIPYITEQLRGTTTAEREALRTKSFHDLWTGLWGPMTNIENRQYKQEYEQARQKFEMLREGVVVNDTTITLTTLLDTTPLLWDTPEWGFPKGRRNSFESDYSCAVREFVEETGLTERDIHIFENVAPIRETFFGNNNIHYCHVYYVAWIHSSIEPKILETNALMNREVGGIGWYSTENALGRIRSTNLEKREVLLRASCLLRSISPLLIGGLATIRNTEGNAINRSAKNELVNPWNRNGGSGGRGGEQHGIRVSQFGSSEFGGGSGSRISSRSSSNYTFSFVEDNEECTPCSTKGK